MEQAIELLISQGGASSPEIETTLVTHLYSGIETPDPRRDASLSVKMPHRLNHALSIVAARKIRSVEYVVNVAVPNYDIENRHPPRRNAIQ